MTISNLRHREVFDAAQYTDKHIVIVGLGAIGSHLLSQLVCAGLENITAIDFDTVEGHNLANQIYTQRDVGLPKVEAAKLWVTDKCGEDTANKIRWLNQKVDEQSLGLIGDVDVFISAVDTFDARRLLMKLAQEAWADVFFESGMATQHFAKYGVNPDDADDVARWEATLGDDNDPAYETSACGDSLTVGATACMCACFVAWDVMNYLKTGYVDPQVRVDVSPAMVGRHGNR